MRAAGTLAVIDDLRGMKHYYLRAAVFHRYGVSIYVRIGMPIPLLNEEIVRRVGVSNEDLTATVYDYGVPRRTRPNLGVVTYAELRSGEIKINNRRIPTAPLSSLYKAKQIAAELKERIINGRFLLTAPVAKLPFRDGVKPLREEVK